MMEELLAILADMETRIRDRLPLVIDLSHWTVSPDFVKAKAYGVAGVIYKITQGTAYPSANSPDLAEYLIRRSAAKAAQIAWADFHFGDDSNPEKQVEFFLKVSGTTGLKALDVERNPPQYGGSMSLAQAERFVVHYHQLQGRWPLLYSSASKLNSFDMSKTSPLLNCDLWVASYRASPLLPSQWKTYKLWQFTDGQLPAPSRIPGIGYCDQSYFNGTLQEFKQYSLLA